MSEQIFSVRLDKNTAKWVNKQSHKNKRPSDVIRNAIFAAMGKQSDDNHEGSQVKDLKLIRKLLEALITQQCTEPRKIIDDSVAIVYREMINEN